MNGKDEQKKSLDFDHFDFGRGGGNPPVIATISLKDPYPHPFTGGQKV
jgi:hypothetical protein